METQEGVMNAACKNVYNYFFRLRQLESLLHFLNAWACMAMCKTCQSVEVLPLVAREWPTYAGCLPAAFLELYWYSMGTEPPQVPHLHLGILFLLVCLCDYKENPRPDNLHTVEVYFLHFWRLRSLRLRHQ